MKIYVTVSCEEDDALREIARQGFDLSDKEYLRHLYVTANTTTNGFDRDVRKVLDFDFVASTA